MVDDMSPGAFIRPTVVVGAEVDVHLPVFKFLPG